MTPEEMEERLTPECEHCWYPMVMDDIDKDGNPDWYCEQCEAEE